MPEYSAEAISAYDALNDFANYILTTDWGGRGSGKTTKAIAAAAKSKASSVLAQSSVEAAQKGPEEQNLQQELTSLLNKYSAENASGTPDFILAQYLLSTLYHFEEVIQERAKWRGEPVGLPSLEKLNENSEVACKAEPDVKLRPLLTDQTESVGSSATIKKGFFSGFGRA